MTKYRFGKASGWWKAYFALIACMLMVLSSTIPPAIANGFGNYPVPPGQDWIIENTTSVSNETLLVDGNVDIHSGGVLTLTNITLFINSTTDGGRGIIIRSGGTLVATDTTVLPYNVTMRINFQSWGDVCLNNVNVLHL